MDNRVVLIAALAVGIGAFAAVVAAGLLKLIGLFTNLFFFQRAATDLVCGVVERFAPTRFVAERPSTDPNTVSPQSICAHVCGAAYRYAHYIRKARAVDFVERYNVKPGEVGSPTVVRGLLTDAIRLTEVTVEPLLSATEEQIQALSFNVRWGPRYDPEMMLEHAVCHVLRHRRQLERW